MDKFYEYAIDTEMMRKGKYTKSELQTSTIDERLKRQGIKWESIKDAKQFSHLFGERYLETEAVFSQMTKLDWFSCLVFGCIGALSSAYAREPFRKLHDGGYRKQDGMFNYKIQKFLEHPGDLMDQETGPLTHRVKYGHDILNFKEIHECIIDKKDYFVDEGNPVIQATIKSLGGYIKHICLADPFSAQGLPLPGNSLFRSELARVAQNHQEIYSAFFTLKHRDLFGAALVAALTKGYKVINGIEKNSYKYYEINIMAQVFCLIFGMVVGYASADLKNSFNYYSLGKLSVDLFRVNMLSEQIRKKMYVDANYRVEELKGIISKIDNNQGDVCLLLEE